MSSITQRTNAMSGSKNGIEIKGVLDSLLADVTALRTAITTLTAKIDTDTTAQNIAVTDSQLDEDYATTCDPASLTTTS